MCLNYFVGADGDLKRSDIAFVTVACEMRRHISAYLKGLPHAAEFRSRFHKMDTQVQFMELLDEYRTCAYAYYDAYPKQLGAQS